MRNDDMHLPAQMEHLLFMHHHLPPYIMSTDAPQQPTTSTTDQPPQRAGAMANAGFSLALCILVLLPVASLAQAPQQQQQQQRRQRSGEQCNVDQLEALEPTRRLQSEAGISEFWDQNHEQFRCVGASLVRHTIEPRGLFLPSSSNSPRLVYVVEGEGIGGLVIPGCHESFQSTQEYSSSQRRQSHGGRRSFGEEERRSTREGSQQEEDQHQKVHRLSRGYILAVPAGVPVWSYNNGDRPLVIVVLLDTANFANQLDNTPRRFFLGGSNPQQRGQHGSQSTHRRGGSSYDQEQSSGNIFQGFDVNLLAEALGVNEETARKLQGVEQQQRGFIIRVDESLHTIRPRISSSEYEESERGSRRRGGSSERRGSSSEREEERSSEEWRRRQQRRGNGIEETLCNIRFSENIGNPIFSDVYSREGGHLTSLNSQKLPILSYLQLSAEKGHLRRNAIMGPQWNVNSHSIVYVVRGSARVQIADSNGNSVLDERVRQDQIFVVPQNFVVLARAEDNDFEWISFKTSDNAISNNVAGKGSTLRGIPVDVLANSFQISREEARRLKEGRSQELAVFVPQQSSSSSSREERRAIE